MLKFSAILSLIANPDKLMFVTVEECLSMDDALNHLDKEFPSWQVEKISRS
jgi:hypothetical protein